MSKNGQVKVLSEAERTLMQDLWDGWTMEEIAEDTGKSASTLRTHLASVKKKYGLETRSIVALCREAHDRGEVTDDEPANARATA